MRSVGPTPNCTYRYAASTSRFASCTTISEKRIRALSGASNATAQGLRQLPRHCTSIMFIPLPANSRRSAARISSPNVPLRGVSRGHVRHIAIVSIKRSSADAWTGSSRIPRYSTRVMDTCASPSITPCAHVSTSCILGVERSKSRHLLARLLHSQLTQVQQ